MKLGKSVDEVKEGGEGKLRKRSRGSEGNGSTGNEWSGSR